MKDLILYVCRFPTVSMTTATHFVQSQTLTTETVSAVITRTFASYGDPHVFLISKMLTAIVKVILRSLPE